MLPLLVFLSWPEEVTGFEPGFRGLPEPADAKDGMAVIVIIAGAI